MRADPDGRTGREIGDERLIPYAGRWVAQIRGRVVGHGGTPELARRAALSVRFKEIPEVFYVPSLQPLNFSVLVERVAEVLPSEMPVYLVGGAVRDALLNLESHDLDFVMAGDVLAIARQVANRIGAAFFVLDAERSTARLILDEPGGERAVLDFSAMRGPDLDSDLRSRDFTINAMAVDVRATQELYDPLGGAIDLRQKRLKACSSESIREDPLRILRAIRFAAGFNLLIAPETRAQMHRDVNLIVKVSAERIRDELFRILAGPKPGASLRALNILGVFPFILPELETLKKVQQSPPHHNDVWRHSLEVVDRLDEVLDALDPSYDPDKAANLFLGVLVLRLGRYRHQIAAHLEQPVSLERPLRALLFFAALYHDVGKPVTQQVDEQGKIRFFGHDQIGAALAAERGRELRLNNQEIDRLKTIIRRHMWPTLMAQEPTGPGRRAVYRFFRATGPAGIDICLLSLADTLATYGPELSPDTWARHLDVVRILFEAWWEYPEQQVNPPAIVNGNDLMERFGLPPGPLIGELLELIREAQASAEISTAEEAYKLVESKI